MTRMRRITIAFAITILIASAPKASHAGLTLYQTNGAFTQALSSLGYDVDNILFNQPGSITQGDTVRGFTQGGVGLDITNTDVGLEVTNTQNAGQASIRGIDNSLFNWIQIDPLTEPSPPNTGSLIAISFNAQTLNVTGTLTLSGLATSSGAFSRSRDNENGNVFFGLIATAEEITQLTLTADDLSGGLVSIENIGQFRVAPGGLDPAPPAVPEPSTFALAIGCIVPLAAIRVIRRRRQLKANAA